MVTVTGAIQDLVADGVEVAAGALQISLVLPDIDEPITTLAPFTVQAVDGSFTFEVPASDAGNAYRLLFKGIQGLDTYWVQVPAVDVTLSDLIASHQVDPTSFAPVDSAPTIRDELDTLDGRVTVLEEGGGGGGGAVSSVNAKTGAVVLTQDDVADGTTAKQYTATEKSKLATIAAGAEVNVNPDWNSASGDSQILNKPTIPSSTPTYLGTLTGHATNGNVLSTDGAGTYSFIAPTGGSGAVDSVNGSTGVVVLDQDDIADGVTAKQYTATEKTKLAGVASGAEVNVNADWSAISGDAQILNKPTLGTAAAAASTDFATAAQGAKADTALQSAPVTSVAGKTGAVTLSASDVSAVPTTRTVAGKALSADVTLAAGDVGAVPTTRTVAGKALSADVTLAASDVGAVPTTRTVAGHALSADVSLVKGDVGLGNVDNTSDANKPVSTAQQTALDAKLDDSQFLNGLTGIWIGTQAQYDAIGSKTSTVLYAVTP